MGRNDGSDSDHSGGGGATTKKGKARRELPAGAVATLKAWLLSPEHFTHPYPTPQDQVMLMQQTGIDKKQLKNWFTNARRRIWKPMLKKQLEQGKIATTGTASGGMAVSGAIPGVMVPPAAGTPGASDAVDTHSAQSMQTHYQQAVQQQDQTQQVRLYELIMTVEWGCRRMYLILMLVSGSSVSRHIVRCLRQSNATAAFSSGGTAIQRKLAAVLPIRSTATRWSPGSCSHGYERFYWIASANVGLLARQYVECQHGKERQSCRPHGTFCS